jgi:methylated-DNA-[protein]-cysteine S-methyltransferase
LFAGGECSEGGRKKWKSEKKERKKMTTNRQKERKNSVFMQRHATPCGEVVLASVGTELCLCDWNRMPCAAKNIRRMVRLLGAEVTEEPSAVIVRTEQELDEYFAGRRRTFDIPLHTVGTDFQKRVWDALTEIPFGETRTYKDIAVRVGNPAGVRAVAGAIGANGISILIPCHRVIGSDGSLTGFAGGINAKRILLELENNSAGQLVF